MTTREKMKLADKLTTVFYKKIKDLKPSLYAEDDKIYQKYSPLYDRALDLAIKYGEM